jgi:hypothetical protein
MSVRANFVDFRAFALTPGCRALVGVDAVAAAGRPGLRVSRRAILAGQSRLRV